MRRPATASRAPRTNKRPAWAPLARAVAFHHQFPDACFTGSRIPRLIHRCWLDADSRPLPGELRSCVASFEGAAPPVLQLVWTDAECAEFVAAYYPGALHTYRRLAQPVLRADLFRYMVLHTFGGVYADVDCELLRPIDEWVSEWAGAPPLSLIVGVEADPERSDWRRWYARRLQWCQWTVAAAPGHPVLRAVIDESLRRLERGEHSSVMELTGPGVWTDAVNHWLEAAHGRSWSEFLGLRRAVRVGDAALLTITAFSPGVGHMGSEPESSPQALVAHRFMGRWKRRSRPRRLPAGQWVRAQLERWRHRPG